MAWFDPWSSKGLFLETPAGLRRLVLVLYAVVGPLFLAVLFLLGDRALHPWSLAVVAALTALGGGWLLLRPSPAKGDWLFPVAVAPIVCCGIAFDALGTWGLPFLGLLGAPLVGAAVLFEAPVVWTAFAVTVTTCFFMLVPRSGAAAAGVGAAVYAVVSGLVVWVVHGKAWRVRALLRAMPDLLIRADAQGRFLDVHAAPGAVLPVTQDELLGRRLDVLVPPEDGERLRTVVERALASPSVQTLEYSVTHDGGARHFEARLARSGPGEVFLIRRDVTERVAGELALRDSEARLRHVLGERDAVLDNTTVGITEVRHGKQIWANRRMEELFGYSAEEMAGQSPLMFHPSRQAYEHLSQDATPVLGEGKIFVGELQLRRKDGSLLWSRLQGRAVDPPNLAAGCIWLFEDLSHGKEMEERLRDTEERYRSLVSAMAEGVIFHRADGTIAACNASAERILGLTAGQRQDGPQAIAAWPLIREDGTTLPPGEHPTLSTLRTGRAVSGTILGVRKPGGTVWTSINSEPLHQGDGKTLSGVVTTLADITETKLQHDLLRVSERRLALVLEGSNDGFWDLDLQSGRLTFSARCFEIIGEEPQAEMISADYWWSRLHPDEVPTVRQVLVAHLKGETERIDLEYRIRDAGGRWKWVRALGMAVERSGGRATRLAGTLRDLTERRQAAEKLRSALARNETLVDELRGALASVKTLSGLLPVCAWCQKVRDDTGYWERIEAYVAQHTDAIFTHGMCPDCYAKHFPDDDRSAP